MVMKSQLENGLDVRKLEQCSSSNLRSVLIFREERISSCAFLSSLDAAFNELIIN